MSSKRIVREKAPSSRGRISKRASIKSVFGEVVKRATITSVSVVVLN